MSVAATGELRLPRADGSLERFVPGEPTVFERPRAPLRSRVFLAATHVVADPLAPGDSVGAAIDWEATLAYRRHIWSWGLGVAEAMDTAQRGMGVGWEQARELIARSAAAARESGGLLAAGAGTDQLPGGAGGLARRDPRRLPRAVRVRRGAGLPTDRHGEPRARGGRDRAGGLSERLRRSCSSAPAGP